MNLTHGLALPNGTTYSWGAIRPGRYVLTAPLPSGKWTVVYARTASAAQQAGQSLSQQLETANREAKGRIAAAYLDLGVAATETSFMDRSGITKLLEDIQAGKVATVYIWGRDRISRRMDEWIEFDRVCSTNGVQVRFSGSEEARVLVEDRDEVWEQR